MWYDIRPTGEMVTSSLIGQRISAGDVAVAGDLLGSFDRLCGTVVHGAALGRTIGFPTANLDVEGASVIPAPGVYAGTVVVDGTRHGCAVNVGFRPTVSDATRVTVEAHLIDFDGDLYGSMLAIAFVDRLRDERRFGSIDELQDQLGRDVAAVNAVLRRRPDE